MKLKLLPNWINFRIVENNIGVYTAQISRIDTSIRFSAEDRLHLIAYAREYMSVKLGYPLTNQWGKAPIV